MCVIKDKYQKQVKIVRIEIRNISSSVMHSVKRLPSCYLIGMIKVAKTQFTRPLHVFIADVSGDAWKGTVSNHSIFVDMDLIVEFFLLKSQCCI